MPKLLELFCGTKSIGKEFEKLGWEVISLDFDPQFEPTIVADVLTLPFSYFSGFDVIWASPPCQAFSVAQIGRNWYHDNTPKTASALQGLQILQKTLDFIDYVKPKYYFIENPRGKMRKILDLPLQTVTYCQYGDFRMKPTDIWTNSGWVGRPACKNGDTCHTPAPRGSQTGTQGMKDAVSKAVIPAELCKEIAEYCTKNCPNNQ